MSGASEAARERRRPWLTVVTVVVLPLVLAGLAAVEAAEDPRPLERPRAFLDCVPYENARRVSEINDFMRSEASSPAFVGADVGASAQLSDGRSIWVFGDTVRPRDEDGPFMVRNSLLLFGDGCASVYVPADRGAAIPNRPDGVGYWPTSISVVPGEDGVDRAAIGLFRVEATGDGIWDFRILGSSVARFEVDPQGVPRLLGVVDVRADAYDDTRPMWGAAVTLTPRWVYIFGTAMSEEPYDFGYALHVARTSVDDYLELTSWRYWDGTDWVADESASLPVLPARNGVSRVLTVFSQEGSWYAVSKRNEFIGDELAIWKADSPTGPYDDGTPVADIPTEGQHFRYMPLAHPGLLPREGTVVVSWSNNVADPEMLMEDPRLYRPRFRRVPLP